MKEVLLMNTDGTAKKGYSLILTEKERERLAIIVAGHIDLTLNPQLTEAGKIGNTQRLMELTRAIELEKGILAKLYNDQAGNPRF